MHAYDNARNAPRFSVVMPVYNVEQYVEEAIRSVLAQTVADWELIVIDDRSTDGSYNKVLAIAQEDSRVIVCQNEKNSGVAKTRNRGIEMSRGEYIAFLDSDDAWYPEKLQRQLELLQKENAGMAYCSYAIVGPTGEPVKGDYIVPATTDFESLLKENVILCSTMFIRADIAKEILFNTEFYHEDFVLALDILRAGHKAAGCTDVLMSWRYINNSRSFNKVRCAKNRWRIYREYLGYSALRSAYLFVHYGFAGLRKYLRRK